MTFAKTRNYVRLITVVASLVLFFLVCLGVGLYIRAAHLSSKSASLDNKIAELSITQASLEAGIKTRSSDAYIEQQAREQLGLIKNNEEVYVVD